MLFQHCPRTLKNRLNFAPRGFLSQLGRFWKPTWPPKRTQNPHFFGFKRQLMLKRAKTQNLTRVLHLEHIFASPGRPETHKKSMKNRSQEASMLSLFFDKNVNFWAPTWVPRRAKIASKTGLETKLHEVCLRSCVFHPPGGSRTLSGPGYGALRPLIFDDFMTKCFSEASSKTRPEGDEREEKKLREAELLKNASEPRRSGAKPPWIKNCKNNS